VNRHLVIFASLFLLLWAAISIGCFSKSAEEGSDSNAPSNKSAMFGPKEVTLLPGTAVTVRLSSAVGSKLSAKGGHFSAIVVRPMEVNGKVVVPAGAEALGRIVEAVPQGRLKGAAELRLVLETVTLDKDSYDVKTGSFDCYLKGKGKRSATLISGGAGGGAAGGGKGALIGAALGAGAGTAGSAYTAEDEIVLPAESALSFKLTEPVTIKL
jgi:hypothetical protein